MGAGCALTLKQKYPGVQMQLGDLVGRLGNHVYLLTTEKGGKTYLKTPWKEFFPPYHIFSFPTKEHWKDNSKLELIQQSARELEVLTSSFEMKSVVIPWPGCGLGRLDRDAVREVLTPILDGRFYIIGH